MTTSGFSIFLVAIDGARVYSWSPSYIQHRSFIPLLDSYTWRDIKHYLSIFFQFHTFPCFCVAITTCDLKCELFLFSQLPELIFFCCLGGLQANVYPMCVCITPHQLFSCYCLESGRLSYPVARFRCRSSIF